MLRSGRLPVCLSQVLAQNGAFRARILIGNPMLEVEPTGRRGRTATGSGRNANEAVAGAIHYHIKSVLHDCHRPRI